MNRRGVRGRPRKRDGKGALEPRPARNGLHSVWSSKHVSLLKNGKSNQKPRAINGRSLAHQKLSTRQRAAIGAQLVKDEAKLAFSVSDAARVAGCSIPYVAAACRWSPEKREAVVRGITLPKAAPPKPKVITITPFSPPPEISDEYLADLIHKVGVDRVLNITCAVEKEESAPKATAPRPSLQEGWLKAHPQYAYTADA